MYQLEGPILRDLYCRLRYGTGGFDYSWEYNTQREQCVKIIPETGEVATTRLPTEAEKEGGFLTRIENTAFWIALGVGGILLYSVVKK